MKSLLTAGASALALIICLPSSQADTITGNIFNNVFYVQNSNSAPLAPTGYFISIGASYSVANDFTSASANYPGAGSPQPLTQNSPTSLNFSSPFFSTLPALHAAYPFGTYTITASGPGGTQTADVPYTADLFETSAVPYLTNYSSLNGLNPDTGITVTYPSFIPNPATSPNDAFTFLSFIFFNQATGVVVFSDGFQSTSSTSAFIPAGTFAPNTTYSFELDFSNRLDVFDTAHSTFTLQGFDVRTDGMFTTGAATVPEPTTLALFGTALAVFGLVRQRRQRRCVARDDIGADGMPFVAT